MLPKTDINGKLVQFAWWALTTIVFTLVVAIRFRLLEIPLERDEGGYAYAGQLIRRPDSAEAIFNWANEYVAQNYTAAGFLNITPTETDCFFGDVPQSVGTVKDYILIYRRNL